MAQRKTTVKAIDALHCIRSGMTDTELMEKFHLSANALRSLFEQLVSAGILRTEELEVRTSQWSSAVILEETKPETRPELPQKKPVIDAADALQCIQDGMEDAALMKRYRLSARGLESLLDKLANAGLISQTEFQRRTIGPRQADTAAQDSEPSEVMSASRTKIAANRIVAAVREGVDDAGLMEKFNLSCDELQAVFRRLVAAGLLTVDEMDARAELAEPSVILAMQGATTLPGPPQKPVIDAEDAVNCIKAGMDDTELMTRYQLSARGLQSLFSRLVTAGLISRAAIVERAEASQGSVVLDEEVTEIHTPGLPEETVDLARIVEDLRAGVHPEAIMEKYSISSKALQDLFDQAVAQGVITRAELNERLYGHSNRFEIRDRLNGKLICSGEARSLGALVEKVVADRVDLSHADLVGANLARRDLSGAVLSHADLTKAILVGSDLTGADLSRALLKSADLYAANLYKANLAEADLSDSNMAMVNAVWAFLPKANLSEANLTNANLTGANLGGANVFESILTGAKLTGAYIEGANVEYARDTTYDRPNRPAGPS